MVDPTESLGVLPPPSDSAERLDRRALVLGIGNILLTDDGVGVHVTEFLRAGQSEGKVPGTVAIRDGGTIGLSLLSEIDAEISLIALDAMEMGEPAGTVRCFTGVYMDRQLKGKKKTAHEVALADLMQAAQFSGCAPERRALIAIQPGATGLGLVPTPAVAAAIPVAAQLVLETLKGWFDEQRHP